MFREKNVDDAIRGIEYFNIKKDNSVDVIIIARGGGSLEDLMPFNEELLVKKSLSQKYQLFLLLDTKQITLCVILSLIPELQHLQLQLK